MMLSFQLRRFFSVLNLLVLRHNDEHSSNILLPAIAESSLHVFGTCHAATTVSSDSVTGALSHGVSVIVECLCTRRRSTH